MIHPATIAIRKEVYDYYGGHCKRCPVTDYDMLELDHIDGGGNVERRLKRIFGYRKYKEITRLITAGTPPRFQLLCRNCNHAKGQHEGAKKKGEDLTCTDQGNQILADGYTQVLAPETHRQLFDYLDQEMPMRIHQRPSPAHIPVPWWKRLLRRC